MTVNGSIAIVNGIIGVCAIVRFALFIWFAHKTGTLRLWPWPVPAYVFLSVAPLLLGIVVLQGVIFRIHDLPWPFGTNDPATLVIRCIIALILIVQSVRIGQGQLLTSGDRQRLRDTG